MLKSYIYLIKEFLKTTTNDKIIEEKTRTRNPCGTEDFYDRMQLLNKY